MLYKQGIEFTSAFSWKMSYNTYIVNYIHEGIDELVYFKEKGVAIVTDNSKYDISSTMSGLW